MYLSACSVLDICKEIKDVALLKYIVLWRRKTINTYTKSKNGIPRCEGATRTYIGCRS